MSTRSLALPARLRHSARRVPSRLSPPRTGEGSPVGVLAAGEFPGPLVPPSPRPAQLRHPESSPRVTASPREMQMRARTAGTKTAAPCRLLPDAAENAPRAMHAECGLETQTQGGGPPATSQLVTLHHE
ncbi:unnamed protein product [Lampetra planeri]